MVWSGTPKANLGKLQWSQNQAACVALAWTIRSNTNDMHVQLDRLKVDVRLKASLLSFVRNIYYFKIPYTLLSDLCQMPPDFEQIWLCWSVLNQKQDCSSYIFFKQWVMNFSQLHKVLLFLLMQDAGMTAIPSCVSIQINWLPHISFGLFVFLNTRLTPGRGGWVKQMTDVFFHLFSSSSCICSSRDLSCQKHSMVFQRQSDVFWTVCIYGKGDGWEMN